MNEQNVSLKKSLIFIQIKYLSTIFNTLCKYSAIKPFKTGKKTKQSLNVIKPIIFKTTIRIN